MYIEKFMWLMSLKSFNSNKDKGEIFVMVNGELRRVKYVHPSNDGMGNAVIRLLGEED